MTHSDADQTMATERYLLGEMNGEDLDAFEEHMFDCTECAAAVRNGAAFTGNARAVFRERPDLFAASGVEDNSVGFFRRWFAFPQLATGLAVLALLCVVGYQQFVVIAGLRAPRLMAVFAPPGAERGAESAKITTVIPHGVESFNIRLDLYKPCIDSACIARVRDAQGRLGPAISLAPGRIALIGFTRTVTKPGEYAVVVQSRNPVKDWDYTFRVE